MKFISEETEHESDIPYLDDLSADDGWQGIPGKPSGNCGPREADLCLRPARREIPWRLISGRWGDE